MKIGASFPLLNGSIAFCLFVCFFWTIRETGFSRPQRNGETEIEKELEREMKSEDLARRNGQLVINSTNKESLRAPVPAPAHGNGRSRNGGAIFFSLLEFHFVSIFVWFVRFFFFPPRCLESRCPFRPTDAWLIRRMAVVFSSSPDHPRPPQTTPDHQPLSTEGNPLRRKEIR